MFKLFNNMFSGSKPVTVTNTKDTTTNTIDVITQLRAQVETLDKRNNYLDKKIKNAVQEVRAIASTDKKKALRLLNNKKNMETEIEKNGGIINMMEKQISSLESSIINSEVFKTMEKGQQYIKSTQNNVNVDKMEELMDDIDDQQVITQSITDIFTQRLDSVYGDEELLAQLNEYEEEESTNHKDAKDAKDAKETDKKIMLPEVPKNKILSEEEEEEEQLRMLSL